MVVNALTQLEDLLKDKKYSEIAQSLAVRASPLRAQSLRLLKAFHRL